jgi:hypothetical protein
MEKPVHAFQERGADTTVQDAASRSKRPIMLRSLLLISRRLPIYACPSCIPMMTKPSISDCQKEEVSFASLFVNYSQ